MKFTWKSAASITLATAMGMTLAASRLAAMDGYFSNGYGPQCKALAGACTAVMQGTLAPSSNPAAMFWAGSRVDMGITFFNPNREFEVTGSPSRYPGTFPMTPGKVKSDTNLFVVPDFGLNWQMKENTTFGMAVYTNGGMNTNYKQPVYGPNPAGISMQQMYFTPTVAHRFGSRHIVGATAIAAWQTFKAEGLSVLEGFSSDPTKMTDNGKANSMGMGGRFGYLGDWSKWLTFGASYQTKIQMSKLDKYKGLFAEQGRFSIPSLYNVGVNLKPSEKVSVSLDVERILFGGITSMSNPMLPNLKVAKFGNDNGPGFGTEDITIGRIGVQFTPRKTWTFRGGFSYGQEPIPSSEVLFNLMSPGVLTTHVAGGFTHALGNGKLLHFSLVRALPASLVGPNGLEAPGQQQIALRMNQWEVTVGFSFSLKR